MDKLEFDGKSVNVVDYKTGDPDKAIQNYKPHPIKILLVATIGDRLCFTRSWLIIMSKKDWKVVSTEFDFIEPDKKKKYRKEKLFITPADIETVSQQINDGMAKDTGS